VMGDLRVYSLSHALMFNVQFHHCATSTGDQFFITVFSSKFFAIPIHVRLESWA